MELNKIQKQFINEKLINLSKSKFRNSFNLTEKEILYIDNKGLSIIENHAYKFIEERLAPKIILNNGKQTPMRGHPVFIAQHATATCCRDCLYKWHHIEKNRELSDREIKFIVALIMTWIEKNYQIKNKIQNK